MCIFPRIPLFLYNLKTRNFKVWLFLYSGFYGWYQHRIFSGSSREQCIYGWYLRSQSVSQKANCLPRFLEKVFTSCFDLLLTYSHNKYGQKNHLLYEACTLPEKWKTVQLVIFAENRIMTERAKTLCHGALNG